MEATFTEDNLKLTKKEIVSKYATAITTIEHKDRRIAELSAKLTNAERDLGLQAASKQINNSKQHDLEKILARLDTLKAELEKSIDFNNRVSAELVRRINIHKFLTDTITQALKYDEYVIESISTFVEKKEVK